MRKRKLLENVLMYQGHQAIIACTRSRSEQAHTSFLGVTKVFFKSWIIHFIWNIGEQCISFDEWISDYIKVGKFFFDHIVRGGICGMKDTSHHADGTLTSSSCLKSLTFEEYFKKRGFKYGHSFPLLKKSYFTCVLQFIQNIYSLMWCWPNIESFKWILKVTKNVIICGKSLVCST